MATRLMDEKAYAAHQAKVKRSYWAIDKSEMANLAIKKPAPPKKRPKYGNEVVIEDGIRMASRKEMKRYRELALLLKAGEIHWLCRQVRFILAGGIEYVADFVYGKAIKGDFHTEFSITVEDVKAAPTGRLASYRMKKKLMFDKYGIDIQEV